LRVARIGDVAIGLHRIHDLVKVLHR